MESVEKDVNEINEYNLWVTRLGELDTLMSQTSNVYAYNNYVDEYNTLVSKINEFNGVDT